MIPEISEFSYGFALTNEIVGWVPFSTAPVFPSLIEEGQRGGGYDVKLDKPGAPLYLQFKRADYMVRSNAREIKDYGLNLSLPFHRFPITQRNKSFQHTSLVALDNGNNLVFYAAPRFHLASEINDAWRNERVAERSIFIAPSTIGLIYDNDKHHVAYDAQNTYFCSEPKKITPLSAEDLSNAINDRLTKDKRSVRDKLPEWLNNIREQRNSARQVQQKIEDDVKALRMEKDKSQQRLLDFNDTFSQFKALSTPQTPEPTIEKAPEIRKERELSEQERTLRAISDEALHGFGAQFFVVQPFS